jgi:hypothetical protein
MAAAVTGSVVHSISVENSEIMVKGPERIFIEKAGHLQTVPGVRLTSESLMVAVKNIARRLGDDISEAKPTLDSRMPDGSQVAAVIPPCSIHGLALTIQSTQSKRDINTFPLHINCEPNSVSYACPVFLRAPVFPRASDKN